ncbi:MAG: translesion DNA synthesis-associated protein ImuA [Pseudomonadota bacterium]
MRYRVEAMAQKLADPQTAPLFPIESPTTAHTPLSATSPTPKKSPASTPSRNDGTAELLRHPQLWQARQLKQNDECWSSGYSAFDAALNGWPRSGLTELLLDRPGIGELQLLLPLMRTLSDQQRWIVWINPPHLPCAPALEAAGVDLGKILMIHPRSSEDLLWAMERCLQSGTASLVMTWVGGRALQEQDLTASQSRRLKLAAKAGRSLACLFRGIAAKDQASLANLRLQLVPEVTKTPTAIGRPAALCVSVCKRQGGWAGAEFTVQPDSPVSRLHTQERRFREQLMLWRHRRTDRSQPVACPPEASTNRSAPSGLPKRTITPIVH